MIRNDAELKHAVDQLQRMYLALAELHRDIQPKNPRQFALFAEGPNDQITALQKEIDEYTGRDKLAPMEADIWLRLLGDGLEWPDAPTSVVTAYLDALRKGLQSVIEYNLNGGLAGRPSRAARRFSNIQVSKVMAGSVCIGVNLPDVGEEGFEGDHNAAVETANRSLDEFLQVISWVASEQPPDVLERISSDQQKQKVLLNAVKPFLPRPRGDVESLEISGRLIRSDQPLRLTRESQQRLNKAIDRDVHAQIETIEGDLRLIDLDDRQFVLRNTDGLHETRCSFEEELAEAAKEYLDRRVLVTGIRTVDPRRKSAIPLQVIRLEVVEDEVNDRGAL